MYRFGVRKSREAKRHVVMIYQKCIVAFTFLSVGLDLALLKTGPLHSAPILTHGTIAILCLNSHVLHEAPTLLSEFANVHGCVSQLHKLTHVTLTS